ncbi:MAG: hypothetical protein M0009_09965, partial [Deltaproteobacteria bacterium]|nr:hypothetical protein [Deltaproteobacteria bacterium]
SGSVVPFLRDNGIYTLDDLKVNGCMPDLLVFMTTDVWGGGAKRIMADVKKELAETDRLSLWDSRWDGWGGLPMVHMPFCYAPSPPPVNSDGTFNTVPRAEDLRWWSDTVLIHEMGHGVLGLPDIYSQDHGPWDIFDIMGGGSAWDNFPSLISSFSQERCGWFEIEDMPRRTMRGLTIEPFDTYNTALRFPNGPMGFPETVTLENRVLWERFRPDNPETSLGDMLFAYRIDPKQRMIVPRSDNANPTRRYSSVIYRPEHYGNGWGVRGYNHLTGTGDKLANSLNYLGENWWEFTNIQVTDGRTIQFDAEFKPENLLKGYTHANWTNGEGTALTPDYFMNGAGNVIMMNKSLPLSSGLRYDHVLSLNPPDQPYGKVRGTFKPAMTQDPSRLYVTAAIPLRNYSNTSMILRVLDCGNNDSVLAQVLLEHGRDIRTLVVNLPGRGEMKIAIEADADENVKIDTLYLLEAYHVPVSPVLYDFIGSAPDAQWTTKSGVIAFGEREPHNGEVYLSPYAPMQNGRVYGGDVLATAPEAVRDGFIEGSYPLVIPSGPSTLRAEVGFDEDNETNCQESGGLKVSVYFVRDADGQQAMLLNPTALKKYPEVGAKGNENNPVSSIAIPIPNRLRGEAGRLVIKVEANGSKYNKLQWPMLRLTES